MAEEPDERGGRKKGWGARILTDGRVEFRIWAPGADDMCVVVEEEPHSMRNEGDGWHTLVVDATAPGTPYSFRLPDGQEVPDPASMAQSCDVHGPSILVDHRAFSWRHPDFAGRPWHESVILELHIGTFTPEGTFRGAIEKLPQVRDAGFTAIEIMPVAHFRGERGWGYDGVLAYAPHVAYGRPDDLKALIDAAHGLGLMVFLDVVYNHFGPEGNHLPRYAAPFFSQDEPTPWGEAVAFEQPAVRRYFLDNARMWIGDYRFDGLRFDATEQLRDLGEEHFLEEIARTLRHDFRDRYLHLIAEDQRCRTGYLLRDDRNQPRVFTGMWADSLHHSLHVRVTGEGVGHYAQVADDNWRKLQRAVAVGFLRPEGEDTVSPDCFVNFLQNHDQIGNRAFGNRLHTTIDPRLYEVMTAMLLLMPHTPMMFMGEEYGETNPFCFFADFTGELAEAMRLNRVTEAENFGGMPKDTTIKDLPDPMAVDTFKSSKLDWRHVETEVGRRRLTVVRSLIALRQRHVAALISTGAPATGDIIETPEGLLAVDWTFPDGHLGLRMNFTDSPRALPDVTGAIIYATDAERHVDARILSSLPGPGIVVAVHRLEAAAR